MSRQRLPRAQPPKLPTTTSHCLVLPQYKMLKNMTADEKRAKDLTKIVRRREIVKAKLDKSVQTLQFRESLEPVSVEEGKIGVVLFASFGNAGGDMEDVTGVIDKVVVRGGIDRLMVGRPLTRATTA